MAQKVSVRENPGESCIKQADLEYACRVTAVWGELDAMPYVPSKGKQTSAGSLSDVWAGHALAL